MMACGFELLKIGPNRTSGVRIFAFMGIIIVGQMLLRLFKP